MATSIPGGFTRIVLSTILPCKVARVCPGRASEFGLRMHGQAVTWTQDKLSCLGRTASVSPVAGVIKLRILLDRTSLEVFANGGQISMSSCLVPVEQNTALELYAKGGEVRIE